MKFLIKKYTLLLILISYAGHAQNIAIKGQIYNTDKAAIINASIVIYVDGLIDGYVYSNDLGYYKIKSKSLKKNDTLKLVVNSLGYKSVTKIISSQEVKEIVQDFILEEKVEELNEVVLEAWEKMKVSGDTVTFRADTYMNGSEQVVEDLLKNLPGIEVLKDGNIKVNGKSIDKLLIEGDDLFDEKYKLLSKNLDAKNISEVQILSNFEDNPVLKSFQESDKVAINLTLNEDKKNVWFGNASIGVGSDERYSGSINVGLLKKKIKFFNLTNFNNTRNLAVSQVKNSGGLNILDSEAEKKFEKESNTIVDINNVVDPNFSDNEDVFNNSFLNSLALVTNLSERTKLRSLNYYVLDKISKQNTNIVQYFATPETVEFSEEKKITTKDIFLATELEIKHFSKDNTYFKYDFSFENNPTITNGNVLTNNNMIFQVQDDEKYNFFNHLNITKSLKENKLLSVYAYYGVNHTTQNYTVQPNVFNEQLGGNPPRLTRIKQNTNSPLRYTGLSAEIISKYKRSELGFELSGGLENDEIKSSFILDNQLPVDSLSNNTNFRTATLSVSGSYTYYFSQKLKLKSSVNIAQNYLTLNDDKSQLFFFNPQIGLAYKKDEIGSFGLNYRITNNQPPIQYLNENFILKNYRTFTKGLSDIIPTKNQSLNLRYTYKSFEKLFLINSFFSYSFSNVNYGFESIVDKTSSFNTYKILEGGDMFNSNLGINSYLKSLPLSFRLNIFQSWSTNFVDVNNSLGIVKNYNSNYRLQGTTYLNIPLNFKFHLQFNYSTGEFDNQKTSNDYIEASLNPILELSDKWVIEIRNDFYSINNNNFLFTNAEINFNPIKSKWSYQLIGSNLSNIQEFSNVYISEFQSSKSSFRIVPRYFILNAKYRF
ncbi:hypothetical protein FGM00_19575 [Aggregatimonas sangjinii]|uniref:TonB-dependent receptor n=1 Tax=Aggregatimonas sangjinii TaxID=2583587 RepID=A0A5B7SY90_9FLAO|nr:carboxypeptidase-like regulatory domain-containing protein [Aggregatimonas sangjinii]QCX02209.1 hypothetical protein FGM00_19575 [Aggregatimonas sangjinii]